MRWRIQKGGESLKFRIPVGWMLCAFCERGIVANVSKHNQEGLQLLGIQYVFVRRLNVFKLFIIDMYDSKSLPSSGTVNEQGSALLALLD